MCSPNVTTNSTSCCAVRGDGQCCNDGAEDVAGFDIIDVLFNSVALSFILQLDDQMWTLLAPPDPRTDDMTCGGAAHTTDGAAAPRQRNDPEGLVLEWNWLPACTGLVGGAVCKLAARAFCSSWCCGKRGAGASEPAGRTNATGSRPLPLQRVAAFCRRVLACCRVFLVLSFHVCTMAYTCVALMFLVMALPLDTGAGAAGSSSTDYPSAVDKEVVLLVISLTAPIAFFCVLQTLIGLPVSLPAMGASRQSSTPRSHSPCCIAGTSHACCCAGGCCSSCDENLGGSNSSRCMRTAECRAQLRQWYVWCVNVLVPVAVVTFTRVLKACSHGRLCMAGDGGSPLNCVKVSNSTETNYWCVVRWLTLVPILLWLVLAAVVVVAFAMLHRD